MEKIIYISSAEIGGLNSISGLGNSEVFLEELDYVNFHFMLFSTLYQSGANYFQVDFEILPPEILKNPFWKDKFIDIDRNILEKSIAKSAEVLKANFDFKLDKTYRAPQSFYFQDYFTSLFYSTQTGIPFINPNFSETKSFDFLESRMSKELFLAIKNLHSQIETNEISTITPKYSVLKKDIRRFEDILESTSYNNYRDSLMLLENEDDKVEKVKKEIKVNALKLHSKYVGNLNLKDMGFSFLKANKKVADIFLNKPTSIFGDFIIETVEKLVTSKRKISYYNVDEANFMLLWAERIGELTQKGSQEKLSEFLTEYKKNKDKNNR
jgi:hypothetical protein